MTEQSCTREKILEAARERFLHYGYSKTTMSEVARDCEMSAGNIYRFFASKLDIAEEMAWRFNQEVFVEYERIANSSVAPPQRLYDFFAFALQQTYDAIEKEAKILEIAEILRDERPEVFNKQLEQERVYLVKMLEDGVSGGYFRSLDDIPFVAEMFQSAMMKFRFPQLFSRLSLDKLKREMNGVLTLLAASISPGAKTPACVNSE
ncbi:MAG: TetR/AcrR family transcriptional regulator [Pseudomonadota bacterium]